jgi:succinate dehydrogenase/fumarate reductase flavoprotein subunit
MSSKTSCDIIVIGGGSAALEAAIAAKQSGAETVVMVEKAPKHESGGNAQFSHVGFRFVHSGAQELRRRDAEPELIPVLMTLGSSWPGVSRPSTS